MACRQIKDKRDLIRLVRIRVDEVKIDSTGKEDGRGAYLCPARECLKKALKGNQLENTLGCSLSGEIRDQLLKYIEDLPGGTN